MERKSQHCLRSKRKEHALTQDEMAFLLGSNTGSQVSQYETLRVQPGIETMLACQVIFGESVDKLFPDLYEKVDHITKTQAKRLLSTLDDSERNQPKRAFLKRIISGKTHKPESLPWQTKAFTTA